MSIKSDKEEKRKKNEDNRKQKQKLGKIEQKTKIGFVEIPEADEVVDESDDME